MSELDFILNRKKSEEEVKQKEEVSIQQIKEEKNLQQDDSTIKEKMREFIQRDPKIGVWSYPAFLVLQYLYHTVPGFRMSKVAKEALEKGLSEMYPDLFRIATEVAKEEKKI